MERRRIQLSLSDRTSHLQQMADGVLDVLVIGGGITGAGIALDAASRGLSVGLVEKQDFAEGTSSRSTKLIHGGLRYLKQREFRLVKEVGRERAILYRNAPHIVSAETLLLPIVAGGTYGPIGTSFGLWLYDRLAGVSHAERRVMLSKTDTLQHEPLLKEEGLLGSGLYYEYRTDDARLTIEVLKTAAEYGALCVNYAEATEFLYERGLINGALVVDSMHGRAYRVHAKKIVNATGPWVDRMRHQDQSLRGKGLHLTKGVHIVVPFERAPIRQSVYFDVTDGRMIFAIPRGKSTYIGTTDTDYHGNLENPRVTLGDVRYLISGFNSMFPTVNLTSEDVLAGWAGLRPLIHEEGKSASELSRKDEIFVSKTGLVSIAGGKLTGYRKMAERVVDLVMNSLVREEGYSFHPCTTDTIVLSGGQSIDQDGVDELKKQLTRAGFTPGFAADIVGSLLSKYGSNTPDIISLVHSTGSDNSDYDWIIGEFEYGVASEMVTRVSDFLIRRTARMFFERHNLNVIANLLWDYAQKELNWPIQQIDHDKQYWNDMDHLATEFPEKDPATERSQVSKEVTVR